MDIELRRALAKIRGEIASRSFGVNLFWIKSRYGRNMAQKVWEIAKQKRCGLYLEIHRVDIGGHQFYKMKTTQERIAPDWGPMGLQFDMPVFDLSRCVTRSIPGMDIWRSTT